MTTTTTAPQLALDFAGPAAAADTAPANAAHSASTTANDRAAAHDCRDCPPPLPTPGDYTYNIHGYPRDNQQTAAYDWEREAVLPLGDNPRMSPDEIAHLVFQVCADYGLPAPAIDHGLRGRRGWNRWDSPRQNPDNAAIIRHHKSGIEFAVRIVLPNRPYTMTAVYALHELAHYILDANYGGHAVPFHGPEFTALAAELWSRYTGRDKAEMIRAARRRNVAIAAD